MENLKDKSLQQITDVLLTKHGKQTVMLIEMSKSAGKDTQELAAKAGISLFLHEFMDVMHMKMANEN